MATYREDMRWAQHRINAFATYRLRPRLGPIEYADQGDGLPFLASHGVRGCNVGTADSW